MLADVSGEEVEAFMLANGLIKPSSTEPDAPINAPCPDEMPQAQTMQFRS
jgi:monothiol glutaredoxin